ncbi:MAG: hypothetical protein EOO85_17335 [Pedobacter sp.]|nr:MAG: hypothetical protein EOO85_17335 [Pedobacter sp.]
MRNDTDFIAILSYKSIDQGGRKSPARSGYRPTLKFPFSEMQTSGQQTFKDRVFVMPGETIEAAIKIIAVDHFASCLYEGLTFEFMEGERVIGTGIIKQIVNDKLRNNLEHSPVPVQTEVNHEPIFAKEIKQFKIRKTAGMSVNQLYNQLSNGGRIVIYGYCISTIFLTFKLLSPPHFIRAGEKASRYRAKYNLLSFLFGWWGLPWGPIYTLDMLRVNSDKQGGGTDVTDDVLLKLREKYGEGQSENIIEGDISIDYFKT